MTEQELIAKFYEDIKEQHEPTKSDNSRFRIKGIIEQHQDTMCDYLNSLQTTRPYGHRRDR